MKQAGAFRVEVSEDGEGTRVTAIRGEGEITAGGKTYEVRAGEMAELNGTDNPDYQIVAGGASRWSGSLGRAARSARRQFHLREIRFA